jgi:hypothetical protein
MKKNHGMILVTRARRAAVGIMVAIAAIVAACAAPGCSCGNRESAQPGSAAQMEARWGIHITAIRLTAAGRMLDFRYRVTDPKKAEPLVKRGTAAYVLHEKTGIKMAVPETKYGKLRQTARQASANRQYIVMFACPGGIVNRGDRVTVVIGDFKAEHLLIE